MLSKKDFKQIRTIIKEELKEALTAYLVREITVEKGPRKQGDPEKRVEKETLNVLDWIAHYMPYVEGRLNGVQQDMNKVTNKNEAMHNKINVIGNVLIDYEKSMMKIANAADDIKQLDKIDDAKLIEGIKDESDN